MIGPFHPVKFVFHGFRPELFYAGICVIYARKFDQIDLWHYIGVNCSVSVLFTILLTMKIMKGLSNHKRIS
jgi:hypothetical protein